MDEPAFKTKLRRILVASNSERPQSILDFLSQFTNDPTLISATNPSATDLLTLPSSGCVVDARIGPGMDGLEVVATTMFQKFPDKPVIVLYSDETSQWITWLTRVFPTAKLTIAKINALNLQGTLRTFVNDELGYDPSNTNNFRAGLPARV